MKLSKSLIVNVSVAFLTIFVIAVAYKIYLSKTTRFSVQGPKMAFVFQPVKSDLKVGDKISVPLYLTGERVEEATAFDVKINYNTNVLKLTDARPGKFYDKYLTVKWDVPKAWFALAMTPSRPIRKTDPKSPVLNLEFTVISKTENPTISTNSDAIVYIYNTDGFSPQVGSANFTVN